MGRVLLGLRDHKELKVLQGVQEPQVHKDHRVHKVLQDQVVHKEPKVLGDHKVR